MLKRSDFKN